MNLKYINNILDSGEGKRTEFKESEKDIPTNIYDTIVSFANTEGGIIILGADNDGYVKGIDPSQSLKFITNISTALNDMDCVSPSMYLSPTEFDHPDGKLIIIEVDRSSIVHNHAGRIYWRDGDADIDVTGNHAKISEIYFQKRSSYSESVIYPALTIDDLSKDLFIEARSIIRGFRSTHPWISISDEQLLRESSLYTKDYKTGEEGLTLAAALIFGKDDVIRNILPAYKVEALLRKKDLDRWDDRLVLMTNLIHTYLKLLEFIRKHLPEKFYQEDAQRKDLRELIFREVIGNMIVHREYTDDRSSDMIIYQNEVIVTNPNIPVFHGPLDPNNFSPYPKNPNIRKFFTAFGWTDEIGSGVRNTTKYLNYYVPEAKPIFFENDLFRTLVPLSYISLSQFANSFITWIDLPIESEDHLKKGLSQIQLDPDLLSVEWKDLILYLVPSWNENGTKLEELDWPKKQELTEEKIKMVPGWNENGTKLMHKKMVYLIKVLILTTEPLKLDKIMEWMDYKNRKRFRDNYIMPLRKVEFISMTIPDNPSDPNQKYEITEKGKLFLAGKDI